MKKFLLTRKTGSWTDFIPIAIVLSMLLFLISEILTLILPDGLMGLPFIENTAIALMGNADRAKFLLNYFLTIIAWILFILVTLIFRKNRPILRNLGYRKGGNTFRGAFIGLLIGFLANGVCVLISWLMGDIVLSFNGFEPAAFFALLVAIFIQSGSEEIIERGYLYQKLRRGYKQPWIAIVINAVAFMSIHLFNPGMNIVAVAQITIVGLIFSLFIYYFDCMWAAIMMHTAWNFTQNIIFGLPNSGIVSEYSMFKLEQASARNGLFYNVNFGVEGSVGAVCVLLLILIVTFIIGHKGGERNDIWAEAEAEILQKEKAQAFTE